MKNFCQIFYYFLILLAYQNHALAEDKISCDEIVTQIRLSNYQLEEIERSWISRQIPNKGNSILSVPAEIAWKSLSICDSWGNAPSSALVYASHYPLNETYFFLYDKGLAGKEIQIIYDSASLATMLTIFPLGVAINLVSYSAAYTRKELFKKLVEKKLDKLNRQYDEAC